MGSVRPSPCPFCGTKDPYFDGDTESIVCERRSCGATGPTMLGVKFDPETDEAIKEAAITAWNKRV